MQERAATIIKEMEKKLEALRGGMCNHSARVPDIMCNLSKQRKKHFARILNFNKMSAVLSPMSFRKRIKHSIKKTGQYNCFRETWAIALNWILVRTRQICLVSGSWKMRW